MTCAHTISCCVAKETTRFIPQTYRAIRATKILSRALGKGRGRPCGSYPLIVFDYHAKSGCCFFHRARVCKRPIGDAILGMGRGWTRPSATWYHADFGYSIDQTVQAHVRRSAGKKRPLASRLLWSLKVTGSGTDSARSANNDFI